jgi:hypothetical protein
VTKLVQIAALAALAFVLCGFDNAEFEYQVGAYRGQPVAAALARFGRPIETAFLQGEKIYFWRVRLAPDNLCKIWGAARHGVMLHWGYQSCAF